MAGSLFAKFLRLPSWERALLLRSIRILALARLAITVLPFHLARRLVAGSRAVPRESTVTPAQVRWAVANAARVVPGATCLPRAVAAESLLRRAGRQPAMRIGVTKTEAGKLEAHAWVEENGRIVVGDLPRHEMARYKPLPPLPDPGAR